MLIDVSIYKNSVIKFDKFKLWLNIYAKDRITNMVWLLYRKGIYNVKD